MSTHLPQLIKTQSNPPVVEYPLELKKNRTSWLNTRFENKYALIIKSNIFCNNFNQTVWWWADKGNRCEFTFVISISAIKVISTLLIYSNLTTYHWEKYPSNLRVSQSKLSFLTIGSDKLILNRQKPRCLIQFGDHCHNMTQNLDISTKKESKHAAYFYDIAYAIHIVLDDTIITWFSVRWHQLPASNMSLNCW